MPNICKKQGSRSGHSSSLEDYLEAIFVLSEDFGSSVRVTDLSERLGVSKPSVSVAMKRLVAAGYVSHERYGDIRLTPSGRKRAAVVASRHDLLHRFLAEILGVSTETAEQDACRLEHDLSDESVERLTEFVEFLTGSRESEATEVELAFRAHLEKGIHHRDLIDRA